MNPENLQKVVDTIKTLNINFNDATTQKIADVIRPMFTLFIVKEILMGALAFAAIIILIVAIYKLAFKAIQDDKEIQLKKIEKGDDY